MKRLAFIGVVTVFLAHAAGALLGGSLDPFAWPPLVAAATALIVAPLIALGLCVAEGVVE